MAEDTDLLARYQHAGEEAAEKMVELVRQQRASIVNRPAIGRKLTRQERLDQHRLFLGDAFRQSEEWDALTARFKLMPDKPIPRRFVDYARFAWQEVQQAEKET